MEESRGGAGAADGAQTWPPGAEVVAARAEHDALEQEPRAWLAERQRQRRTEQTRAIARRRPGYR